MNTIKPYYLFFVLIIITYSNVLMAQKPDKNGAIQIDTLHYGFQDKGLELLIHFSAGPEHNHPLMVVWAEDMNGEYLETLYIAESIGKGIFRYGDSKGGKWKPGPVKRPAALPYWMHKRHSKSPEQSLLPDSTNPMPDAISGPTPLKDFVLNMKTERPYKNSFFILLEINQSWDWNDYWTNNRFPDDKEYKTSSQPAIVYRAKIDPSEGTQVVLMEAIGHSHWSGKNGTLYTDLSNISTALKIAEKIEVQLK